MNEKNHVDEGELYKNENWLRVQILEKERTHSDIAEECGCHSTNISRYKRKFGIKKPWKDEETIRDMYVNKSMNQREIAEELGCTRDTVRSRLRKYDISEDDRVDFDAGPSVWYSGGYDKAWQDPSVLTGLYNKRKFDTYRMADILQCVNSNVGYWMDEHDIDRRDKGESERLNNGTKNATKFYTSTQGREKWYDYHDGEIFDVSCQRLLAVAKYGFDEVRDMQVHHKNKIYWDNRPDNIELMTISDHSSHHAEQDERWKNMHTGVA